MVADFIDILCCPTCRTQLTCSKNVLQCSKCSRTTQLDGRFIDFSQMTYNLPLDLGKHIQGLTEDAGQLMKDIEIDWRVKTVLEAVRKRAACVTCLEIGGADGPMTPTLEKLFEVVLTIDCSKAFLKRIEAKTKSTICLLGDAHFLPVQNQSVDIVVCSEVLEHATIPTQLLTEIRRVLKKSGTAIISVPNEFTLDIRRKRVVTHVIAGDTHINFFTPESLRKVAYRTGFDMVDIQTLLPPNRSIRAFLRNIISLVQKGFYGSFILCVLKPMENPWIYWESFYEKIRS